MMISGRTNKHPAVPEHNLCISRLGNSIVDHRQAAQPRSLVAPPKGGPADLSPIVEQLWRYSLTNYYLFGYWLWVVGHLATCCSAFGHLIIGC